MAGRPKLHTTPEAKATAVKEWRKAAKEKTKNISVDADLVEILNEQADRMVDELGFRPTLSQTLRYLIKKNGKQS